LMLESENRGEGILTDDELMGDLGIFFIGNWRAKCPGNASYD
jgi:hypothetical protein